MTNQYVQHISRQGEKWLLREGPACADVWVVEHPIHGHLTLPATEYQLCEPLEDWADITAECTASQMQLYHDDLAVHVYAPTYRLRKIQFFNPTVKEAKLMYGFIVEQCKT